MNLRYKTIKMNNKNNKQLMNNDFLFTFVFVLAVFVVFSYLDPVLLMLLKFNLQNCCEIE